MPNFFAPIFLTYLIFVCHNLYIQFVLFCLIPVYNYQISQYFVSLFEFL